MIHYYDMIISYDSFPMLDTLRMKEFKVIYNQMKFRQTYVNQTPKQTL